MKWEDLRKDLRERIIRQEPQYFNQAGIVAAVHRPKSEQNQVPALDEGFKARKKRRYRLVIDNLPSAFKGVRDGIAKSIGLDDGDRRFRWQYRQVETAGEEGTLVTIEVIG